MKSAASFMTSLLFVSAIAAAASAPALAAAQSGLVPCGTQSSGGVVTDPCGWNDFFTLANNIANFLIITGAAVATLAFAYAGFLMLTAGGETGKIQEAKAIFGKVLIGFLFMLGAWLIVHAIDAMIAGSFLDNSVLKSSVI
ncbi:hypothetical protein KGQ31_00085 [Patescibacteria group bacterium]|nr:hypothetical protein [Patescibacteria group bacterium]